MGLRQALQAPAEGLVALMSIRKSLILSDRLKKAWLAPSL